MPTIRLETKINAPVEICFDVARSIDIHQRAAIKRKERAVAGVTSGLLGSGESVTWEAVHFGVRQLLTSRITEYDPPYLFVDEMVKGAFHSFRHVHRFRRVKGGTLMLDVFTYVSPLGLLGWLADKLFLERYMLRFLRERNRYLKRAAERNALTK